MAVKIGVSEEKWRIVEVYMKGDMKEKLEVELKGWLEEQEKSKWTIIGGDFNTRTGNLGGGIEEGVEEGNPKIIKKIQRWKD